MAADGRLVFAAYGNVFSAFARNKEVCITELFCILQSAIDCHGVGGNFNVALHLRHSRRFFFCFVF